MSGAPQVLLDSTDRARRLLQHGAIWLGIGFLIVAGAVLKRSIEGSAGAIGGAAAGAGLLVMASGFAVRQKWTLDYKGHQIRFQNDPFRGERLFIDDRMLAKGGLGRRMVLLAVVPGGEGAGDRIVATSDAGFTSFRCRIVAEPSGSPRS